MADSDSSSGPVFFFGVDGGYGFLSQFYSCQFTAPSPEDPKKILTFNKAEQYMMYGKAMCFDDFKTAKEILATDKPRKQKSLGRQVKGFTEEKWDLHKEAVVEEGSWYKFTASPEEDKLAQKLLATGDRELIEASPYDRVWGIGFTAATAESNRSHWGQNLLGKALVRVRDRLRNREQAQAHDAGGNEGSKAANEE